jgi:hypothetical protein
VKFVSKRFAKQASEMFPKEVTILTEKELERFWNEHITAHLPDQLPDHNELVALNARLQIMKQLEDDQSEVRERIEKALDPENPAIGVRTHPYKEWKRFKKKNHIRIASV